jgi:hypothetical protein
VFALIADFNLNIPTLLTSVSSQGGNPVSQLLSSFDCAIAEIPEQDIKTVFLRAFIAFIQPFVYILFLIAAFFIVAKIKKLLKSTENFRFSVASIGIFIYFYFQPGVTQTLIRAVSCRQIGS